MLKQLGAVLVFIDTLKVLQPGDPKDDNIELLFKCIVPSLKQSAL